MFGMYKGTQGIHLWLRLTACDKKNETFPLMSATSITKQSAWICFTACVVVTSDTMSSTPEFQRDSVSDGWITGRTNLTTFVLVKSSRSDRVIYYYYYYYYLLQVIYKAKQPVTPDQQVKKSTSRLITYIYT